MPKKQHLKLKYGRVAQGLLRKNDNRTPKNLRLHRLTLVAYCKGKSVADICSAELEEIYPHPPTNGKRYLSRQTFWRMVSKNKRWPKTGEERKKATSYGTGGKLDGGIGYYNGRKRRPSPDAEMQRLKNLGITVTKGALYTRRSREIAKRRKRIIFYQKPDFSSEIKSEIKLTAQIRPLRKVSLVLTKAETDNDPVEILGMVVTTAEELRAFLEKAQSTSFKPTHDDWIKMDRKAKALPHKYWEVGQTLDGWGV